MTTKSPARSGLYTITGVTRVKDKNGDRYALSTNYLRGPTVYVDASLSDELVRGFINGGLRVTHDARNPAKVATVAVRPSGLTTEFLVKPWFAANPV